MDFEELIAQLEAAYAADPDSLAEAVAAIPAEHLAGLRDELAQTILDARERFANGEGTEEDRDAAREAATYLAAVRERMTAEESAVEEMAAEVTELAEGLEPEDGDEGDAEAEEESEESEDTEAEEDTDAEEDEGDDEVTASSRPLPRPGSLRNRRPRGATPRQTTHVASLTAAGDVDGFRPGHGFTSPEELARAIHDTGAALRGRGDGRKYVVARMEMEGDVELGADAFENWNALQALTAGLENAGMEEILAAGGNCAPEEPMFGFFNIAQEDGILRLPGATASRGKVGIPTSPSIDDLFAEDAWDAAVGDVWTEEEDVAVDPDSPETWKNCYFVPCDVSASYKVQAAYTCLEFGNWVAKFWPESVANNTRLSLIAHAHKVNAQQIAALQALATTEAAIDLGDQGTIVQLIHNLEIQADEYRDKYRMGVNSRLNLYLPFWVLSAVYADYVARISTTDFDRARGWFDSTLSARGFNTQYLHDWQSIVGENDFPITAEAIIEAPGTSVALNEGRLDLGVTRSPEFNRQNKYQQFFETWQGVAKVGHEVRRITGIPVYPTGETGTHSGITVPAS